MEGITLVFIGWKAMYVLFGYLQSRVHDSLWLRTVDFYQVRAMKAWGDDSVSKVIATQA